MCGLAGLVISPKRRSDDELDYIRRLFTSLLANSEHRGPYATGVAVMSKEGGYCVVKEPLMATEFVESARYRRLMDRIDADTAMLMGHTRHPTRGSHLDNRNNHPLVSGEPVEVLGENGRSAHVLLAHNGHISNSSLLFASMRLRRESRVDTEILLRFIERNVRAKGIDVEGLIYDLSRCRGRLSIVAVSTNRPDQVLLIKGNMPLEVWHHAKRRLLAYASENEILARSVGDEGGWRALEIPSWRVVVVNTKRLLPLRSYQFACLSDAGTGGATCR